MLQTSLISIENSAGHVTLLRNIFADRHRNFVSFPEGRETDNSTLEFDQYDSPESIWLVVHDESSNVLAAVRLTPTTVRSGIYSYSLRDAQRGLLSQLPSTILESKAPVDPMTWEFSNFFVSENLTSAVLREVYALIFEKIFQHCQKWGVSKLIGLMSSSWPRWMMRLSINAQSAGPILRISEKEYQCVLLKVGMLDFLDVDQNIEQKENVDSGSTEDAFIPPARGGSHPLEAHALTSMSSENWLAAEMLSIVYRARKLFSEIEDHVASIKERCKLLIGDENGRN